MFESILATIRLARRELAKKNVRGSIIIIELEQREWDHFKYEMPRAVIVSTAFGADSCQLEGATVRLKK